MLLTSGQISVFVSSSVVFIFTSLLFLSGYILQQQTVNSLRAAINPHLPPTPTLPTSNPVYQKHFGTPPGHSFYDKFLASNRPKGGWAKVAFVSLLRRHADVCGAVMGMRELSDGESMAQRVLMYPRAWDEKPKDNKAKSRKVETSRRLLRKAAKDYKVMLQPIDAIPSANISTGLTPEEKYPLTNLLSLVNFNRIISLQAPGLVLDATPLDLLFTLPMEDPLLGLSSTQETRANPSILLMLSSKETYTSITSSLPEGAYPDAEFLQRAILDAAPADPGAQTRLLAETGLLNEDSIADFNATEFLEGTSYVRLVDDGIPGPEFDVSKEAWGRARPEGTQARKAWEAVYARFREARIEVCGLDLEQPGKAEEVGELR